MAVRESEDIKLSRGQRCSFKRHSRGGKVYCDMFTNCLSVRIHVYTHLGYLPKGYNTLAHRHGSRHWSSLRTRSSCRIPDYSKAWPPTPPPRHPSPQKKHGYMDTQTISPKDKKTLSTTINTYVESVPRRGESSLRVLSFHVHRC